MTERDADSNDLMAQCMDMVRQDLIDAGIVDKSVPPMMVPEAVFAFCNALRREKDAEIAELKRDSELLIAVSERERHFAEELRDRAKKAEHECAMLMKVIADKNERNTMLTLEANRFAAMRHSAREDGEEDALIEAVDVYRDRHGL